MKSAAIQGKKSSMAAFPVDPADPLRRSGVESVRANAAFRDYVAMGEGRSLEKLLAAYIHRASTEQLPSLKLNTLKKWSQRHAWQARLAAWEATQHAIEEDRWSKRREELRLDDFALGAKLRDMVLDFLEVLPLVIEGRRIKAGERIIVDPQTREKIREIGYVQYVRMNATPAQLGQAARAASELQRLAAGMEPNGQTPKEPPLVKQGYVLILPDNGRGVPSMTVPPANPEDVQREAEILEKAREEYQKARLLEAAKRTGGAPLASHPPEPEEPDNSVNQEGFSLPSNGRDGALNGKNTGSKTKKG
ncbi:MAG: hypothetical protein V3T65_00660 [Acidobacteriota bacterium]